MAHIVVDPVTRIEGHLRVEAEVDGGAVKDAWSSSTMFRGIELILRGRDPRDAWAFHPADLRRVHHRPCDRLDSRRRERHRRDAAAERPAAAQPHHGGADGPGPRRPLSTICTRSTGSSDRGALAPIRPRPPRSPSRSRTGRCRARIIFPACGTDIKAFVQRGQLGHRSPTPTGAIPPIGCRPRPTSWRWRTISRRSTCSVASSGSTPFSAGKNPHLQSFLVGGMATPVDLDSQNALNMDTIAALDKLVAEGRDFVSRVYIPDVLAIASLLQGLGVHRRRRRQLHGLWRVSGGRRRESAAVPADGHHPQPRADESRAVDQARITEQVAHSWYDYSVGRRQGA